MKAVFSISKFSHQNRLLSWQTGGTHHFLPHTAVATAHPTSARVVRCTVPSLIHLSVARTLATLRPRKTHYEVLNLSHSATAKDIKLAFITLSKLCHPDASSNPEDHKTFVLVNEAYSILSRPESRRVYDASLTTAHHVNTGNARSYGFHPQSEPYTHYRAHNNYDDTHWARNNTGRSTGNIFTSFYTITACVTCAVIGLIFLYMDKYYPDSRLKGLKNNFKSQEIEQHDFIMTSQHEGATVYYYAVPKVTDPENFEVLAVKRNQVKDSDLLEMQGLNSIEYSKLDPLQ